MPSCCVECNSLYINTSLYPFDGVLPCCPLLGYRTLYTYCKHVLLLTGIELWYTLFMESLKGVTVSLRARISICICKFWKNDKQRQLGRLTNEGFSDEKGHF